MGKALMTARECEDRGYEEGLAEGLRAALGGKIPSGYVAVPADLADGLVIPHSLAATEGIAFVRRAGETAPDPDLWTRLAAARLGVTRRVLDGATQRLGERLSRGVPLLHMQLVAGGLADIVAGIELIRAILDVPDMAHGRISELDWEITMLYGGAGYITEMPTQALYVSALVANVWGVHR
jgi:hypothetical protein